MKTFMKAAVGVLGVGVAGLTYGVIEARRFTVRHVEVPVLKPGSSPLRVLHLSDFHMLAHQKATIKACASGLYCTKFGVGLPKKIIK